MTESVQGYAGPYHAPTPRNHPVNREIIWEGGTFSFVVPRRLKLHQSPFVLGPYARVKNWRIFNQQLVPTFLHQGDTNLSDLAQASERDRSVLCRVTVMEKTFGNGSKTCHLDYVPVGRGAPTMRIRAVKSAAQDFFPEDISTVMTRIMLPNNKGQIVIGVIDKEE